jgi:hypothetical protein
MGWKDPSIDLSQDASTVDFFKKIGNQGGKEREARTRY